MGISALCLGIAMSLVPSNLFASSSSEAEPEDNLTVTVSDERAAVSSLSEQSAASALNFDQESVLKIQDSKSEAVFAQMNKRAEKGAYDRECFYRSDQMSGFSLGFYDEKGNKKDYGTLDLTLTVPESFRRDGFLEVVGLSGDGETLVLVKLEESTEETKSITFVVSGKAVPSGEFVLLSHKTPVTTVSDQRTDTKYGSKTLASVEKELYCDRVLNIESKGKTIKKLIDSNSGYAYDAISPFTITLTDDQGTEISKTLSDYGALTFKLPIPDSMKLSEGSVKLFKVKEDGTLETELSEKTVEENGIGFVAFRTKTPGEFAMAYFSNEKMESVLSVTDTRTDSAGTAKTTVSAKTEYTGQLFLHVEPSEGTVIKTLIDANGTYHYTDISFFKLTMTDASSGGNVIASPPVCTLTMVLPDRMDEEKGRVYLLGIAKDGTLNGNTGTVLTEVSGETFITFETAVMNEYAFLYDAGERYPITTKPADESLSSGSVTAEISSGSSSAKSFVAKKLTQLDAKILLSEAEDEADAATIEDRKQAFLYGQIRSSSAYNAADEVEFYDFYLADSAGKEVDDFGTCTMKLALPDSMNPDKGKIRVLTVKTAVDDTLSLDTSISTTTETVDDVENLCFTTSHFTPFAVLYTENEKESAASETENVEVNSFPKGAASSSAASSASSPSAASGASSPSAASSAAPTPAASNAGTVPVIINDNSMPSAPSNTGSGSTSASASRQESPSGTVADMPKTADATTYRNILVMLFLSFGALMLISSFRFEKNVRRKKDTK